MYTGCYFIHPSIQSLYFHLLGDIVIKDLKKSAQDLVAILKHGQKTQQRVTALKLLDAWNSKGATSLRLSSVVPPRWERADCERVIVHLITEQYLREDFHFTPYSTISYLLPGKLNRWRCKCNGYTVVLCQELC